MGPCVRDDDGTAVQRRRLVPTPATHGRSTTPPHLELIGMDRIEERVASIGTARGGVDGDVGAEILEGVARHRS